MVTAINPFLMDGETVYGYLQRSALIANDGALKSLAKAIVGVKGVQAPWVLPSNLNRIARAMHNVVGSGEELLMKHTIFPAIAPFLTREKRMLLRAAMLQHTSTKGAYFLVGLAHSLSFSSPCVQSYCPKCTSQDEHAFGSYWRRAHQFPYVGSCPFHQCSLVAGSGCCALTERTSGLPRLPGIVCRCRNPAVSVTRDLDEKGWHHDRAIAGLLSEALRFSWPEWLDAQVAGAAYNRRCVDQGFQKGRYLDTTSAVARFRTSIGDSLLERYASPVVEDKNWFRRAVRGVAPSSVVRNVLLIHYLFGSLSKFIAFASDVRGSVPTATRRTMAQPAPTSPRFPVNIPGTPEYLAQRRKFRTAIQKWMESADVCTRTAAQRKLGYVVLWLRERDRAWYDRTLPPVSLGHHASSAKSQWQTHQARSDADGIRHVQHRFAQLTRDDALPLRITRARLLDGLANVQKVRPKTHALADSLAEGPTEFKQRTVLWLMNHPETTPEGVSTLEYAYRRTHLPKREILRLHQLKEALLACSV